MIKYYLKSCIPQISSLFLLASLSVSCMQSDFYNQKPISEDLASYDKEYNNYSEVNLAIQTPYPGVLYSIYFNNPYNESGALSGTPFAVAKSPVNLSLKVPKDIENLYIVGGGRDMLVKEVKDIVTVDTHVAAKRSNYTLGSDKIDEIISIIFSEYFPESNYNFLGDELYKCTDLQIAESLSTGSFEEAEVWLTYLGDGGFDNNSKLWFYTYPSEKLNTLTYKDCTFYGIDEKDNIVEVKAEDIYMHEDGTYVKSLNESFRKDGYLFLNETENRRIENEGSYRRLSLGKFSKGVNIGFVFRGRNERCQFTTPCLNLSEGEYEYIGKEIELTMGGNNIKFTPTNPIANGFIFDVLRDEFTVKVLGMENRTISNPSYDGDYNDMLCLIESNPILLGAVDAVVPGSVDEYVMEKGIYLFEDNYPTIGDYDFNDVVVEYEIKKFINASADKGRQIKNRLLAYGCDLKNEFGYRIGDSEYRKVFDKISGYKNVRDTHSESNIKENVITIAGEEEIRPYLYNGTHHVVDANYNTGAYPYVLIIPSAGNAAKEFCWCVEGKKIKDAYHFAEPRKSDWYLVPKEPRLVVARTAHE